MELKKNPMCDIHRQRGVIYNISLAFSLLLVFAVFNWSTPFRTPASPPIPHTQADADFSYVPVIRDKQATPSSRIPRKFNRTSLDIIAVNEDNSTSNQPDTFIDQGDTINVAAGGVWDIPAEMPVDTVPFIIVEKMPEPVGGWEAFYKTLQKNMRYPKLARRIGISGKVFIQFTVNEKGGLDNLKVLKGIGSGCDEEALRVIALTKWAAGKQRGRPVKVRMAQSIQFRIQ